MSSQLDWLDSIWLMIEIGIIDIGAADDSKQIAEANIIDN